MRTRAETSNVQRQTPSQIDGAVPSSAVSDSSQAAPTALTTQLNGMRVALVHWLISRAGGERVFDAIPSTFPTADLFTLFLDKQNLPSSLDKRKITTSFLDEIPIA